MAAAVVVMGGRHWRYPPPVFWAVGVTLGYLIGDVGLAALDEGLPAALRSVVSPHDAHDWVPLFALIALGTTIFIKLAPESWQKLSIALVVLTSAALPARLLAGSVFVTQRWGNFAQILWLVGLTAAFVAMWVTLSRGGENGAVWLRVPLVIILSMGLAIIQLMSGSLDLSMLSGVGTAALTGAAVAAILPFGPQDGRAAIGAGLSGAAGVITILLGGLIFLGTFFSQITSLNAVLLCLSLAAAGGWLPPALTRQGKTHAIVRSLLCVVPLAIALTLAAVTFAAHLAEQSAYGY